MTDNVPEYPDWRTPRQKLQDEYIARIIDGMDINDLVTYAYDTLSEQYDEMTDEELIGQLKEYYPDLLESIENEAK